MSTISRMISLTIKRTLGLRTPPVALAYRGYGTARRAFLRGHVLDDRLLYEPEAGDSKRKNIRAMISRYFSTAVPGAAVEIDFAGQHRVLHTDDQGYFELLLELEEPLAEGWHPVTFRVHDPMEGDGQRLRRDSEVYISNGQHDYGIISDVDDTILVSHATQTLRKLRLILTKNAKTRLPFPGVPAFYRALCAGSKTNGIANPIFFISSSEWNLYDFLVDFCETKGIPKGVFLLQNLKTGLRDFLRAGGGTHRHKLDKARHLLEVFPHTSFLLIGDSGQHDAHLYAELADEYPDRVLAVYIRDVTNNKNSETIYELYKDHPQLQGKVCLSDDTYATATHAYEHGWISEAQLEKVRQATAEGP
jgi:phosphatidate phosphatase APP1